MRTQQQGATVIGFLILAAIVGVIGFGALKLTPIYLNHMKVASILNDVRLDLDGQGATVRDIRTAIDKRLNIEMVYEPVLNTFQVTKVEGGHKIRIQYERRANYVGNLFLVVEFDDSVEIRR